MVVTTGSFDPPSPRICAPGVAPVAGGPDVSRACVSAAGVLPAPAAGCSGADPQPIAKTRANVRTDRRTSFRIFVSFSSADRLRQGYGGQEAGYYVLRMRVQA